MILALLRSACLVQQTVQCRVDGWLAALPAGSSREPCIRAAELLRQHHCLHNRALQHAAPRHPVRVAIHVRAMQRLQTMQQGIYLMLVFSKLFLSSWLCGRRDGCPVAQHAVAGGVVGTSRFHHAIFLNQAHVIPAHPMARSSNRTVSCSSGWIGFKILQGTGRGRGGHGGRGLRGSGPAGALLGPG